MCNRSDKVVHERRECLGFFVCDTRFEIEAKEAVMKDRQRRVSLLDHEPRRATRVLFHLEAALVAIRFAFRSSHEGTRIHVDD